jgi:hypothetical protein
MIKLHRKQLTALCLAAAIILQPVQISMAALKRGNSSSAVKQVQLTLKKLGYFNYSKATGYFGSITASAVKKFQRENGLTPDGIVGKQTKAVLAKYTPKVKSATYTKTTDGLLDWYNEVQYIWQRGTNATITDVATGESFQVKRTFGTNHADVEPVTKKDSQIIKEIWGGFSWERRAVVVQVGDTVMAASFTAMPHAGVESKPAVQVVSGRSGGYGTGQNLDAVKGNGVSGVMDIHFLNSRTHSTNRLLSSQQNMVKKAAKYIQANY